MAASPTRCGSSSTGSRAKCSRARTRRRASRACNGILVPGGFGQRGAEGKIRAAQFARERKVPYFGICFGMQMAVIEAARHSLRHRGGQLDRIRPDARAGGRPDDRVDARQRAREAPGGRRSRRHHAARRLSRHCSSRGSRIAEIYGDTEISERHRHRYEVNTAYKRPARSEGHALSPACRPTAFCRRSIEFADHPWFIGVQFHPELKSRPFEPHPLFASFIAAAKAQSRLV